MLMLDQAQRFTGSVHWGEYQAALADLAAANALTPPEPGMRLRIPRTAT